MEIITIELFLLIQLSKIWRAIVSMTYLYIMLEIIVGFIALFIIVKLLGKTQLSKITPFDFISALVLGELLGNALFDQKIGITYILFALFLWGILLLSIEYLGQKFIKIRPYTQGSPSIVIRNSIIDRNQLKKNKVNINQLQTLLRQKDIFSVREVEYAILEPNGTLSVLKKPQYSELKQKDLNLQTSGANLSYTIISDGEVLWENLEELGFDKNWLYSHLSAKGITNPKDVYYAEWLAGEGIYILPFNEFSYCK